VTDVLSQKEIEELLAAINAPDTKHEDIKPAANIRKVKKYDFKRPDKFSREQIRSISMIHETFARLTTISLSALLRSMVHVHVASVDQLTYEEFIRSIPTPTTLAVINMAPLNGDALLEIDPAITFSIIDRLFGGTGELTKASHELTDIEASVMEEIIVRTLGNMQKAWAKVIDLQPRLSLIDTNPQFAQIVPPADMVILVTLETKVGDVEGLINICIPHCTIEPIIDKFSTAYLAGRSMPHKIKNYQLHSREDVPVKLSAEIFRRNFSIQEISTWKKDSVLFPLRPVSPNTCFLRLGDRCVWCCEMLPEVKRFPKPVKILAFAEASCTTEGVENMDMVMDALLAAKMNITVELGATDRLVKEVFAMTEGTILELDKLAGEPVDIKANGVLIAKGDVVVIDENFGVRIIEIIGTQRLQESSSEMSHSLQQSLLKQES